MMYTLRAFLALAILSGAFGVARSAHAQQIADSAVQDGLRAQDAAEAQAIKRQILADWQARFAAVQAVRYKFTVRTAFRAGQAERGGGLHSNTTLTLDFAGRRSRIETLQDGTMPGQRAHSSYEVLIQENGIQKRYTPRDMNSSGTPYDLVESLSEDVPALGRIARAPALFGHGVGPLRSDRTFAPLAEWNDEWSVKEITRDESGTPISAVLETEPKFVFGGGGIQQCVIDLTRQSAITRKSSLNLDRTSATRTDVEYKLVESHWLPVRWSYQMRPNDGITETAEVTVTSIEINPAIDDSLFQVDVKPGMNVLRRVPPEAAAGQAWGWILAAGGLTLIMLVGVWLYLKHKKQRMLKMLVVT